MDRLWTFLNYLGAATTVGAVLAICLAAYLHWQNPNPIDLYQDKVLHVGVNAFGCGPIDTDTVWVKGIGVQVHLNIICDD